MQTQVLMTTTEGKRKTFPNMEIARKELKLTRDSLIELIITGEESNGYSLDWGVDTDDSVTDAIELRWTLRKEKLAEKKRRSRENAAQKDMQGLWVQESHTQPNGSVRYVRITAENVVKVQTNNGDRLAD